MPNIFQRMGSAIGRAFGRGSDETVQTQQPIETQAPTRPATVRRPEPAPVQQQPQEEPQRRGFLSRLNPFANRREERERADRERLEQQLAERQRQLDAQGAALARREQAVREQSERLELERANRERIEREQQERVNRERLEQERIAQQMRVAQQLRDAQEADRQRREAERLAREEAARREEERKRATFGKGIPDLGIPAVTGVKGGATIYGMQTSEEVMQRLAEAAAVPGRRASIKVHDKNGWHDLYTNRGRKEGRGMTASEMLDRFSGSGVPGQDAAEHAFSTSVDTDDNDGVSEEGNEEDAPEWEDDGYVSDEDSYDYVGDSDGGDDDDTEGYDPGSVSGYQIVMY